MKKLYKNLSFYYLLITIIIFLYVIFKDVIVHNQHNTNFYLKYYYFCFLLGFFSLISFFISNSLKKNITLFLSSVLFSLYLVEFLLFFSVFNYYPDFFKKPNQDVVNRYEYYIDLKNKNNNKVKIIIHSDYNDEVKNVFPLGVLPNALTVNCNENGYYSLFESDRYGFNNDNKDWDSNAIDFLLLGDSFVQGACVMFEDTITGNLKKDTNKIILNLGNGGNGPLQSYAALKEYFPDQKVHNILWFFFEGNDIKDLYEEMTNPLLINYLQDDNFHQNLKFKQNEINEFFNNKFIAEEKIYLQTIERNQNIDLKVRIQNFYNFFFNFIKLFNLRYNLVEKKSLIFSNNIIKVTIPNEFEILMKKIKVFAKKNKSNLYFVYLPEKARYSNSNYSNDNRKKILSLLSDFNIPVIDITQSFVNHENPQSLFPKNSIHYNEKGYKRLSEEIKKFFVLN